MQRENLPRVLVFGQSFNQLDGGGITLSNLFVNWKDSHRLFSIHSGKESISHEICQDVYTLSREEKTPIILRMFVTSKTRSAPEKEGNGYFKSNSVERSKSRKIIYNLGVLLGVGHFFHVYRLSNSLKSWLADIKPDILYLQFSNLNTMRFGIKLSRYLDIPVVIHVMDDWISLPPISNTISRVKENILTRQLIGGINKALFKRLLKMASLRLVIADSMASEYKRRYGMSFGVAHNYVDLSRWSLADRSNVAREKFVIRYFGTVNLKNIESLRFFAGCIANMENIEFELFTMRNELTLSLERNNTMVLGMLDQKDYQNKLFESDLLLLPLSFDKISLSYTKLSLPTKLSEYLISGVPTVVFAPAPSAVYQFCATNRCAHLIGRKSSQEVRRSVEYLRNSEEYYSVLSERGREVAIKKLSREVVLRDFEKMIKEVCVN